MNLLIRHFVVLILFTALTIPLSDPCNAATVDNVSPLDFGTVAIPSNNVQQSYEMRPSGSINVGQGFILVDPGNPAVFDLTDFPPNQSIVVSVPDMELARIGGGLTDSFLVSDFKTNTLITDDFGQGRLHIGATLTTSGSGLVYLDGNYAAPVSVIVTLQYWSPDDMAFVTQQEVLSIHVNVKTSLSLIEQQSLSFGTVFVKGEPANTAWITIAPNGAYAYDESGNARLVPISPPRPAILNVVGAAPNYEVNITLPTDPVVLKRPTDAPSVPALQVTNFNSTPANTGRTNAQGELEIRVGARMTTELTATDYLYPQGTYSGTYQVTISY